MPLRMFGNVRSDLYFLNAHVQLPDERRQMSSSIEVRAGVATIRKGAKVVEQKAGVTNIEILSPTSARITFDDGQTWGAVRAPKPCGCA